MEQMMSEGEVPEGFTVALALVDAVPVVLFGVAVVMLGVKIGNPVFVLGAVLACMGGAGKVAWKFVMALAGKNVGWLARQMRFTMPLGFVLMIAGLVLAGGDALAVLGALTGMPSVLLLVVWLVCMCAMGYFAGHRDQSSARDNWVEQLVNAAGQAALLAAVLLAG